MQHVAKISCRNGVEIEYGEKKGYKRREKMQHVAKISCRNGELLEIRRDFYLEKLINTGKAYSDRLY